MPIKHLSDGVVMCKLSDFKDIHEGRNPEAVNTGEARDRFERAFDMKDKWSNDPDNGTLNQRLSGDFGYARDLISKVKIGHLDSTNIVSLQPEYEWGMLDGQEVNFDQYLRHDPRCLGRMSMAEAENGDRTIQIAVGIGGNVSISSEKIIEMSSAVLAAVKSYQEAGYNVEVYAFYAANTKHKSVGKIEIAIIDCIDSSDGQILSSLSSTKVLRSMVFGLYQNIPNAHPMTGYPINHNQTPEFIPKVNDRLRSVLGSNIKIIHSGATPVQIKEALK